MKIVKVERNDLFEGIRFIIPRHLVEVLEKHFDFTRRDAISLLADLNEPHLDEANYRNIYLSNGSVLTLAKSKLSEVLFNTLSLVDEFGSNQPEVELALALRRPQVMRYAQIELTIEGDPLNFEVDYVKAIRPLKGVLDNLINPTAVLEQFAQRTQLSQESDHFQLIANEYRINVGFGPWDVNSRFSQHGESLWNVTETAISGFSMKNPEQSPTVAFRVCNHAMDNWFSELATDKQKDAVFKVADNIEEAYYAELE